MLWGQRPTALLTHSHLLFALPVRPHSASALCLLYKRCNSVSKEVSLSKPRHLCAHTPTMHPWRRKSRLATCRMYSTPPKFASMPNSRGLKVCHQDGRFVVGVVAWRRKAPRVFWCAHGDQWTTRPGAHLIVVLVCVIACCLAQSSNQQFGVPLATCPKNADAGYGKAIPAVVVLLAHHLLDAGGLREDGIFRRVCRESSCLGPWSFFFFFSRGHGAFLRQRQRRLSTPRKGR